MICHRRILRAAFIALIALVVWTNYPAAMANHRPWPAEGWRSPDRGVHTFCFDPAHPMDSSAKARVRYSMDNNDGLMRQTIIDTQEYAICSNSIDVKFSQEPIEYNAMGATKCIVVNSSTQRCDQWRVRIAVGRIVADANNPGFQIRKTACHEIGHTVGLEHYGGQFDEYKYSPNLDGTHTCMRSGIWDGGEVWTRNYGQHDRGVIDSRWNS